jgi:hypothetical protein
MLLFGCMQADITCDSDGVLNHFISTRDAVDFDPILPLHELRATEPYPLAMFLTGDAAVDWQRSAVAADIVSWCVACGHVATCTVHVSHGRPVTSLQVSTRRSWAAATTCLAPHMWQRSVLQQTIRASMVRQTHQAVFGTIWLRSSESELCRLSRHHGLNVLSRACRL